MPDPQRDIAPIIEPAAPPMPPAGPDYLLPALLGVGALLLVGVLAWRWRKRAPFRTLHRLALNPHPVAAANALAALIRKHRIAMPSDWQAELERLRFGPPEHGAAESLARLCRQAEAFLKAR